MTVGIPAGGLKLWIGPDGKIKGSLKLHAHFDVCPTWFDLAFCHVKKANEYKKARDAAWSSNNSEAKSDMLQREFESAMQAIMAAATAVEAFYSAVSDKITISDALKKKWRANRTGRYAQVSEVLRQAFGLGAKGTKVFRQNLKEIYRFRDLAVHPRGRLEDPVLHPELQVGVEWRFAFFRAHNADQIVRVAYAMVVDLISTGRPKKKAVQEYSVSLKTLIDQITKID